MRKIMIIGCGGSGKSTFAVQLSKRLMIPVFHLDQLFWKPGWVETPRVEWISTLESLCRQDAWIMDGNFGGTIDVRFASSDTVLFFDLPTRTCLSGALRRLITFRGRSRPDMAPGCPERLDFKYLWWVSTFRLKRRRKILRKLEQQKEKRVLIFNSRRAANDFLEALPLV